MTQFPILDVTHWPVESSEPAGDDPKDWLVDPSGQHWLFKPREVKGGWAQGEDWAEKIAAEVAAALGIPAADIELAVRAGERGSLSRKIIPAGYSLQPGKVLIAELLPDYQARSQGRHGHNLDVIQQVLAGLGPPPGMAGADDLDAFDVFTGYLVLDALIANRDRHEENWAVLLKNADSGSVNVARRSSVSFLAPSYDHATSLGFNFRDSRREAYLSGNQLEGWARKGTAHRFEAKPDGSLHTLVELARDALDRCSRATAGRWRTAVENLSKEAARSIVERTPDMSDLGRTFAVAVVETNRRRLLDGN